MLVRMMSHNLPFCNFTGDIWRFSHTLVATTMFTQFCSWLGLPMRDIGLQLISRAVVTWSPWRSIFFAHSCSYFRLPNRFHIVDIGLQFSFHLISRPLRPPPPWRSTSKLVSSKAPSHRASLLTLTPRIHKCAFVLFVVFSHCYFSGSTNILEFRIM